MSQWSPRTQKVLWISAATVSAAPLVWTLGFALFGGSKMGIQGSHAFGFAIGQCQGWQHQLDLWSVLPGYFFFPGNPWAIVLPAFAMWLITRRRAVGWAAVALLTPYLLVEPLLFGYDVARWGSTCVEAWYPIGAREVFWQVYDLLPLALVLAATYRPRTVVVRTAAALAVTVPLFAAAGDQDGPVPLSSPAACKDIDRPFQARDEISVQAVVSMSQHERKLTYLCGYAVSACDIGLQAP